MCLEILITCPREAAASLGANRLSRASGLHVDSLKTEPGLKSFHIATEPGCSCGLLGENATLDPEVWNLQPTHLPALAKVLELVGSQVGGFRFRARFLGGERDETTSPISTRQLIALVLANEVGNNVTYIVA